MENPLHIKYEDTLRQGTDKLNKAIDFATESLMLAQEGKENADAAALEAREAAGEAGTAADRANTATSDLEGLKEDVGAAIENADSFVYVKEYDPERTYYKNNMATYDGSTYIALEENLGILPSDSTRWGIVARRGVDGMGSVASVNSKGPDEDGNITLTPAEVGAASSQELANLSTELREGINNISDKLDEAYTNVSNFPIIHPEADDTGRIQRAIDACSGIVLLPAGNWKFSNLNLKSHTIIRGVSRDTTILTHVGSGVAIRNNDQNSSIGNVVLEDFRLALGVDSTVGIDFSRVYSSQINRVTIIGNESTGVAIKGSDGATKSAYYNSFYDVSINGHKDGSAILSVGFDLSGSANTTRLTNCRTNYVMTGARIASDYTNHIVMVGCAFEQFDVGVVLGGVGCSVIGCRFENGGGSARGIGINNLSGSNTVVGNFYTNVLTPFQNTSGLFMLRLDYDSLESKYFSHASDGGWTSNMDLRNFALFNPAYIKMQLRTSAPGAATQGSIAYADGTNWAPYGGGAEGLFVKKADGKWIPATQIKVSGPPSEGFWQRGEIVYNSAPTAGGYVGWVCTTAGSPGTWKPFGAIQA